MSQDLFNFPHHTVQTTNPESSFRVKLGNSYTFTAQPDAPDERVFELDFPGLIYTTEIDGDEEVVILGPDPKKCMLTMIRFYQAHKLWDTFQYKHPVHGLLVVRFNKPLTEPPAREGGTGFSESFQIELIEVP